MSTLFDIFLQFFYLLFCLFYYYLLLFFKCINNITGDLRNVNTFFAIFVVFWHFFVLSGFVKPIWGKMIDEDEVIHIDISFSVWSFLCLKFCPIISLLLFPFPYYIILIVISLSFSLLHYPYCYISNY